MLFLGLNNYIINYKSVKENRGVGEVNENQLSSKHCLLRNTFSIGISGEILMKIVF